MYNKITVETLKLTDLPRYTYTVGVELKQRYTELISE